MGNDGVFFIINKCNPSPSVNLPTKPFFFFFSVFFFVSLLRAKSNYLPLWQLLKALDIHRYHPPPPFLTFLSHIFLLSLSFFSSFPYFGIYPKSPVIKFRWIGLPRIILSKVFFKYFLQRLFLTRIDDDLSLFEYVLAFFPLSHSLSLLCFQTTLYVLMTMVLLIDVDRFCDSVICIFATEISSLSMFYFVEEVF